MSLDLEQISAQIAPLTGAAREEQRRYSERLSQAIQALTTLAVEPQVLAERVQADGSDRSFALPIEPLDLRKSAPLPPPYRILAVDGSHTEIERDSPTRFYIINLGWSDISYDGGHADLGKMPSLKTLSVEVDEEGDDGENARTDILPGLQRAVGEFALLAQRAAAAPADLPTVLLIDGNLVLWNLTRLPKQSRWWQELAVGPEGVFTSLGKLKQLSDDHPQLAVAGYISYPDHKQVLRSLQKATNLKPNDLDVGTDRFLFQNYLRPGERSALFKPTLSPHPLRAETDYSKHGHDVYFFYLHTGVEVARVEVPHWCADSQRLELLHQVLLDQCTRGLGYPLALAEADAQAVITTADRAAFQQLLEESLSFEGMDSVASAKNRSKRGRWLT